MSTLLVTAFAGCTTIHRAHEAQAEAEAYLANGDVYVSAADTTKQEVPEHGFPLSWYLKNPVLMRPSFRIARLAVEDARLALKEIDADAPILSTTPWNAVDISASGSYSEASAGTTMGEGEWRTEGNPSASLSLDILIYDFGRHAARAQAQVERVLAAEESLVREGYTALTDLSSAYFTFAEKIALFEAARTNENVYAVHLEQTKERFEAGEAKELDLLRARLDLAQACEAVVASSNEVVSARANFLHAVGVAYPELEVSADRLEADLGLEELVQAFAPSVWTKESAFTLASTNTPAMKIMRARLRATSSEVDRAIADLYPTISASLSLSWTDPLWYFRWGFNAVQSLFTGFRKTTAVDRAVIAMQSAEADLAQAETDLRRDLELALSTRDTAREALRSAVISLKTARENLALVDAEYRLGEADRVEFSEAVRAVTEALGNRASAFYRAQKAEATLFALVGTSPRFSEKIIVEQ